MPHVPRRIAPTSGARPDLTTTPRPSAQSRPPVPYRGSAEGEESFQLGHNQKMIPKLSLRNFQMPVEKVYKVLFGKEPEIDERTRGLVPPPADKT